MSYSFDFINFWFCWVLDILFVLIHMSNIFTVPLSKVYSFLQGITRDEKSSKYHKQTQHFVCFKTQSIVQLALMSLHFSCFSLILLSSAFKKTTHSHVAPTYFSSRLCSESGGSAQWRLRGCE